MYFAHQRHNIHRCASSTQCVDYHFTCGFSFSCCATLRSESKACGLYWHSRLYTCRQCTGALCKRVVFRIYLCPYNSQHLALVEYFMELFFVRTIQVDERVIEYWRTRLTASDNNCNSPPPPPRGTLSPWVVYYRLCVQQDALEKVSSFASGFAAHCL